MTFLLNFHLVSGSVADAKREKYTVLAQKEVRFMKDTVSIPMIMVWCDMMMKEDPNLARG